MFTVLECVAVQHDHAIVLLAAVICLLGMHAFFHLLLRAEESPAGRKPYWVLVAAFAAGLSVWATHFVAMLAYKGSVPIGFDFQFTALSAVLAVLGFWLALRARSQASYSPVIVGTLVTLSVAVMHFVGMAGMDVAATISYRWGPVLGGFAVARVFFCWPFSCSFVPPHGNASSFRPDVRSWQSALCISPPCRPRSCRRIRPSLARIPTIWPE